MPGRSGILAGYLYYEWDALRPAHSLRNAGRRLVDSLPNWFTRPLGLDAVFRPLSPQQGGAGYGGGGARLGGGRRGPRWSPTRGLRNPWAQAGAQGGAQGGQGGQAAGGWGQRSAGVLRGAQGRLLNLVRRGRRAVGPTPTSPRP